MISLLVALAGLLIWTARLRGVVGRAGRDDHATAIPAVSLIVPARDEAHNLPALLASIAALDPALFRRRSYDAVGGHAIARGVVAEDLLFLRRVERAELVLAPGLLRVRMYPEGAGAFLRGWRRNFREGLGAAGPLGVLEVVLVFAALGTPLVLLAGGHLLAGVAGWLLAAAEIARRQRLVGELPAWGALLYPIALLAFAGCTAAAVFDELRRAPVRWRGREFPKDSSCEPTS